MSSSRTARTWTLAACLAAVCVAGAQAKIYGAARSQAKKIAASNTIGKRTPAPAPQSSRRYPGPRMLGAPPRVRVSPYAYGSPYGYGQGYGMVAGYGVPGYYATYSTTPVVTAPVRSVGTARIGLGTTPAATSGSGASAATFRAPVRPSGNDVSFSRVNAARQRFQAQYGFGD